MGYGIGESLSTERTEVLSRTMLGLKISFKSAAVRLLTVDNEMGGWRTMLGLKNIIQVQSCVDENLAWDSGTRTTVYILRRQG